MIDENVIRDIIFDAVDEINQGLEADERLEKTEEAILYGKGSRIDSLSLVNLIVAVEERLQDKLEVSVNLADERAMSQERSPFKTLGRLKNYTVALIAEILNE